MGVEGHPSSSFPSDLPPQYEPRAEPASPLSSSDPHFAISQFSALRISDPVPRASSAMSSRDPIPRLGTSMSMHSSQHPHPHPRHQNTFPVMHNQRSRPSNLGDYSQGANDSMLYLRNNEESQHISGYGDSDGLHSVSLDTDGLSYHSFDDQGSSSSDTYISLASQGTYTENLVRGHLPSHAQGSQSNLAQSQTHPIPSRAGEYNYLYATASGVLGMAPGTSSEPSTGYAESVYSTSHTSLTRQNTVAPNSFPSIGVAPGSMTYQHGLSPFPAVASSAASLMSKGDSTSSGASTIHPDDEEFNLRPALQRHGTSLQIQTRKSKAVDLTAPPYTKEYIDHYRQRIKADPDPEAHFLYAKYLIDAAKKIGADAKDQRTVKKYRDMLITESLKVVRRLATQGEAFAEAQFFLANCYGTGMLGLQVDHERAYHLYLQAAKQNHAAASYRVAVCNEIGAGTRREPPRAAAFYRKAASLGDTAAMYKLGMILLNGSLGEVKNQREAISWLKRAAEQADEENPHALHELGLLHELPNSPLVVHDPAYAKALFMQAAHLGYTQSQYKLGQCFEYGALTCPVDPRRSIAWYTKAAEKGDSEAELALSGWYLTGSEGVLKQSDSEAYLWARRAANKGLSKAEYAVGYYAEVGIGIKQDVEFAKRWYMRAAGMLQLRSIQNHYLVLSCSPRQQACNEPSHRNEAHGEQAYKCGSADASRGQGRVCYLLVASCRRWYC